MADRRQVWWASAENTKKHHSEGQKKNNQGAFDGVFVVSSLALACCKSLDHPDEPGLKR